VHPLNHTCGYLYNHSVAVYRSRDLATFELLTLDAFPAAPAGVRFRVKVVFNERSRLFVMWVRVVPLQGGAGGRAPDWTAETYAAGVSASPAGPFELRAPAVAVRYGPGGDNTLFVDDDGEGYVAYTAHPTGVRVSVERLTPDFLASTNASSGAFGPAHVEAPAMWKRGGVYYVAFGPTCCYCIPGSDVDVYAANAPLGPYTRLGALAKRNQTGPAGSGSGAQQSYIFATAGGELVWTGTRWGSAPDGLFAHDLQTWLPLVWDDSVAPPVPQPLLWQQAFELPG